MTVAGKPTPGKVLDLAEQLTHRQLEQLWPRLNDLRVRKNPGVLSRRETEILRRLYIPASPAEVERFRQLTEKRRRSGLSTTEQTEVEHLVDGFDRLNLERTELLTELSGLRGVSGRTLGQSLGLPRTEYV